MGKAESLDPSGRQSRWNSAELAARDTLLPYLTVGASDDLISALLVPDWLMSAGLRGPGCFVDCSTVSAEASARCGPNRRPRPALLAAPVICNPKWWAGPGK